MRTVEDPIQEIQESLKVGQPSISENRKIVSRIVEISIRQDRLITLARLIRRLGVGWILIWVGLNFMKIPPGYLEVDLPESEPVVEQVPNMSATNITSGPVVVWNVGH